MVPTDKEACRDFRAGKPLPPHYPVFSPFVYSVENSLPIMKFGQAEKWQPDPQPGSAQATCWFGRLENSQFALWFLRVQTTLGWLLATLFVAGVTGIVHKE
jgi:hypothetical protein